MNLLSSWIYHFSILNVSFKRFIHSKEFFRMQFVNILQLDRGSEEKWNMLTIDPKKKKTIALEQTEKKFRLITYRY